MKLESDSVVRHPRQAVFSTFRDSIAQVVPFLPNVRSIEVEDRREEGRLVHLVTHWHGQSPIPSPVDSFLDESMLGWTDRASWDADAWGCDWVIESHAFPKALHCRGQNRFVAVDDDRTRVEIHGTLAIDMRQVRGVPRLARPLGKLVEQFLVRQITSNLTSVARGVQGYLDDR